MPPRPKLERSKLKEILLSVYHDVYREEAKGILIRCPWHDDHNPSCMIFLSGVFHCLVCHGDGERGHKGIDPYRGFQALGMDEARARQFFLDGAATEFVSTTPVPDLTQADCETTIKRAKKILEESVTARESWPIGWAFRDLDDATFQDGWFVDRFEPTKVMLKKERLPRLALKLGGSDALRKRSIMHEVYLRTSTAVKPKAANSKGLTLNIAVPTYADLFGLINSKCMRGCKGLFLVEGPYDALRLLQHLNSKEIGGSFEVVAILGTPQWANVMERIPQALGERSKTPVILAFDNDGAGKKLTDTALWNLQMRFSKRKIIQLEYPETIKDPGDLSFTDFLTAFNSLGL